MSFTGKFYNLTVNKNINLPNANYVGGIGGFNYRYSSQNNQISNISLNINITGNNYVGAFGGKSTKLTLLNSNYTGVIVGNNYVGGVSGYS